jgi:RimJ/RimL family protein N-acetyltransferase
MTAFLGGPESVEQLDNRHARYLDLQSRGEMFVVLDGETAVGTTGYWEHNEGDDFVWETGWAVLPEFWRRGYARQAVHAVIARTTEIRRHKSLHAYPSVENVASNELCRQCGFTLIGPLTFEYPKGEWMTCNNWAHELVWPGQVGR